MGQPEPVRAPRHRSLPELHGRQSPRSVKSAPWESNFDYGLYTSGHDSPTASAGRRDPRHASFVSAGSDSESGISQRKRYFPGRKGSDNESDGSASRRRRRDRDSDSGSEVSFTMANKGRKKRNPNGPIEFKNFDSHILYPFHDKENNQNGSIPSLHSAPAGELKQRRRRRRSKSPGNSKRPPEELKQHIEFDLIDTEGMTEDQLRDITYTKVETKANLFRVKYSPKFRQKIWASRRKSFGDADRNSAPSRTNLSRQESYNTDPAGTTTRGNQDLFDSQYGFRNSPRRDEESHGGRASDWSAPSPGSERSAGRGSGLGGYTSAPSSKAYHNPVYLRHRDAVLATGNDSGNDNRGSTRYRNSSGQDMHHGSSVGNHSSYGDVYGQQPNQQNGSNTINSSKDFNHNRFNYQREHQSSGGASLRQTNYDHASPGRPTHEGLSPYSESYTRAAHQALQSPYDASVGRGESHLNTSRLDPRVTPQRNAQQADSVRIESRGYGATLHRFSGSGPHHPGHAMNGSLPGPGSVPPQYQPSPVNQGQAFVRSSDPRPVRNSYEEGNRGYGPTAPRSMPRPSYSHQPPAAPPHKPGFDRPSPSTPGGYHYSSGRSHTPGYTGHQGQQSGSPSNGHSTDQSRCDPGVMSVQQHDPRNSYGAYSQNSRAQGQPPSYRASTYQEQTPQRPPSGSRQPQRAGYRSDLVTQL
ncbi:hypothetical protein EGW08_008145 [Elysia chlorotica]|uniref:Uncharacterized protein n=1 Tax=Elysia chlorotica TaxID=188477 RepID=A0A433TRK4_ELYCH|nr:hypothetical protein EGW08_008145 [Elysia chlorotica]